MKNHHRSIRNALLVGIVTVAFPAFAAEVTPDRLINADKEPQNWLMNHRTYDSQRYSPLDKINKANVKSLKLAYAVAIGGTSANENLEATPLAEDGFLYVVDQWGVLYKIDGRSGDVGRIIWRMDPGQEKVPLANAATAWALFTIESIDRDRGRSGLMEPVVAVPFEGNRTALGRYRIEGDEWIGCNSGEEVGAKNLLAIIGAYESGNDITRVSLAGTVATKARFHDMRYQGLDLDNIAAFGGLRNVDQRTRHHRFSKQAASVTTTSAEADQNEPSLISAMATMVCVSARRKRVVSLARPDRGPK